ncbi:MAG: pirin family protein, partial [Candidatus Marinimicrobia bacterium]|nr:pirin family protein [Candidatus Neomarinimicrobiota bacterium]
MINIIPFRTLGSANHGWLNAHHHFSFARYYDPGRRGFPPLLVWNDDLIKAGTGFDMHPHDNMEIITYIRKGAITHRDNLGNVGKTVSGDVQVMSAGTGIMHSEHNEETEDTLLFQIWIQSHTQNVTPRWETKAFPKQSENQLIPLASGREIHKDSDVLTIFQDAAVYAGLISKGMSYTFHLEPNRHVYMVAATGSIQVNGITAQARDGIYIKDLSEFEITSTEDAEIVL